MTKSPQCSVRVCGKEMPGLFMQGFYTHSVTFYSSWSLITFNTLKEGEKKKNTAHWDSKTPNREQEHFKKKQKKKPCFNLKINK